MFEPQPRRLSSFSGAHVYPSIRKFTSVILTGTALLIGQAAHAQAATTASDWWPASDRGYIGLNAGRSDFERGHGDAYSLYVGGMWSPQFGLELGGTDFGRGQTAKAYGFYASGIGRMPLNDTFALFGKLGLMYSRSDTGGARDTGFGETYGLGADISVSRQVAAVLQYDRSSVHFVGGRDRVNLASVGLKFRY